MEQFLSGNLAGSICDVYRVEESVRDVADVLLALRAEESPSFLTESPSSSPVTAA